MTITERHLAPAFLVPEQLRPVATQILRLRNGIPVHHLQAHDQQIIRADFVFRAGSRFQKNLFSAGCASQLLIEGTQTRTGSEIAESTDYYGSYVHPFYDRDEAGLTGFFLGKHQERNLELMTDLIRNPVYPEKEIALYKYKRKQQLLLDERKPESVARRGFIEKLFGAHHPYGIHGNPDHVEALDRTSVASFHQSFYRPDQLKIILSTRDAEEGLKTLDKLLGDWKIDRPYPGDPPFPEPPAIQASDPVSLTVEQATQAALRAGHLMPGPDHDDFFKISIVNTLLGGFFGSRLMQNIREEKGLTYHIGSAVVSHENASFLTISSSVAADKLDQALQEIKLEMDRLRNEALSDEELHVLKNYIAGDLQRQLDGPLTSADTYRTLLSIHQDFSFLERYLQTLRQISQEDIRETAAAHFLPDKLVICTAGPMKPSKQ